MVISNKGLLESVLRISLFLNCLHVTLLAPVCMCVREREGAKQAIGRDIKSQEGMFTLAQCVTNYIFTASLSICSPSLTPIGHSAELGEPEHVLFSWWRQIFATLTTEEAT